MSHNRGLSKRGDQEGIFQAQEHGLFSACTHCADEGSIPILYINYGAAMESDIESLHVKAKGTHLWQAS